jgi:hypothetical protein
MLLLIRGERHGSLPGAAVPRQLHARCISALSYSIVAQRKIEILCKRAVVFGPWPHLKMRLHFLESGQFCSDPDQHLSEGCHLQGYVFSRWRLIVERWPRQKCMVNMVRTINQFT